MPFTLIEPARETAAWEAWSTEALEVIRRGFEVQRCELALRLLNVEYSLEAVEAVLRERHR